MHEQQDYVAGPSPVESAAGRFNLTHSQRHCRLRQPGAQQRRTNDTRHLALLAATEMAFVFLHYNEIGFEFGGDARQVLDIVVLAIAGVA